MCVGGLALTVVSHIGPQQRVMAWDVICFDSLIHLVATSVRVTAQLYDDEILQPIMLPFFLRHLKLTFQNDNACVCCYELSYTSFASLVTRSLSQRTPFGML